MQSTQIEFKNFISKLRKDTRIILCCELVGWIHCQNIMLMYVHSCLLMCLFMFVYFILCLFVYFQIAKRFVLFCLSDFLFLCFIHVYFYLIFIHFKSNKKKAKKLCWSWCCRITYCGLDCRLSSKLSWNESKNRYTFI